MDRGFHFSKPRFVPPFVPPLCLCYPLFHAFLGLRLATGPAIEKTLRCCRHATTLTSATRSDNNNNPCGLKNSEPARLRPVRPESAREYLFVSAIARPAVTAPCYVRTSLRTSALRTAVSVATSVATSPLSTSVWLVTGALTAALLTGPKPLQPLLQRPVSVRTSVRSCVRTSAVRTGVLLETVWKHQPWKPAFACQHPVRFCQWRFCCQPAWQLRRWQPACSGDFLVTIVDFQRLLFGYFWLLPVLTFCVLLWTSILEDATKYSANSYISAIK